MSGWRPEPEPPVCRACGKDGLMWPGKLWPLELLAVACVDCVNRWTWENRERITDLERASAAGRACEEAGSEAKAEALCTKWADAYWGLFDSARRAFSG